MLKHTPQMKTQRLLLIEQPKMAAMPTSLLSVPFSVKEEIHHLSLAHTLVKSSFTERGTVFQLPPIFLLKVGDKLSHWLVCSFVAAFAGSFPLRAYV
jgi:hypothetical protein